MMAEPKPLRVLVLGDDPTMVSDEVYGSVGYATLLQPLFDEAVTVEVGASATLLPADPEALLESANKGDVVLLCKRPVLEAAADERTLADVYLDQLLPIVQAAKKKGLKLIMLTPVCPRYFTVDGEQVHRFGIYPDVVRRLCKRDELPLIDLEQLTFDWLAQAGVEGSAEAYVAIVPASAAATDKALREGDLLTPSGAQNVAAMVEKALRADNKNVLFKRLRPAVAQ